MEVPGDWRRLPWFARYRLASRLGSELRRLSVLATHRHCRVEFAGPVRLGPGFHLEIPGGGSFLVGPGVDFRRGFVCEISGDGLVSIGANSVFTHGALIQCTTSIEIGEDCVFGQSALLVDGSHRFRDIEQPVRDQGYDYRPLRIGRGANVMSKCTIFADIGERAFVGANSVVSRPIPAFCVAVGAPARVIEYFGPPDRRPPELGDDPGA
ncbi:MAG: acyltransferase [Acidimicrobiales bacterium]